MRQDARTVLHRCAVRPAVQLMLYCRQGYCYVMLANSDGGKADLAVGGMRVPRGAGAQRDLRALSFYLGIEHKDVRGPPARQLDAICYLQFSRLQYAVLLLFFADEFLRNPGRS